MSPGSIVVTGGSGFVGANFLRLSVPRSPERLFVNADALTYAANPESLDAIAERDNYRFERIDIVDREQVEALFARYRPELVVHFAAETHVDRSLVAPDAFIRTNVHGTFNLLEALRGLAAVRPDTLLLHVSTDEVYGSLPASGAFTEQSPYAPSSPYSASKAASDLLVLAYAHSYGLRVKLTHASNNYGPYQFPEKLIPLMILRALAHEPLPVYGDGQHVRDWLHVEDHCEAIWAVIERGQLGARYNVGARNELRNLDVVHKICAAVADETGARLPDLLALIRHVRDRPGHDRRYALDPSRVMRECGWTPKRGFDEGLRSTVRFYLENPAWVEAARSSTRHRSAPPSTSKSESDKIESR